MTRIRIAILVLALLVSMVLGQVDQQHMDMAEEGRNELTKRYTIPDYDWDPNEDRECITAITNPDERWKAWKQYFERNYRSPEEEAYRHTLWKRLDGVIAKNREEGDGSAHGFYSDMTGDEMSVWIGH